MIIVASSYLTKKPVSVSVQMYIRYLYVGYLYVRYNVRYKKWYEHEVQTSSLFPVLHGMKYKIWNTYWKWFCHMHGVTFPSRTHLHWERIYLLAFHHLHCTSIFIFIMIITPSLALIISYRFHFYLSIKWFLCFFFKFPLFHLITSQTHLTLS